MTRTISLEQIIRCALLPSASGWLLCTMLSSCAALAPDSLELGRAASGGKQTHDASPLDASSENTLDAGRDMGARDAALDAAPEGSAPQPPVLLVVEAESYDVIDPNMSPRSFYLTAKGKGGPAPDPDPSHASTASGATYLEVLPDTRVTKDDPSTNAVFLEAGTGPIVSYFLSFPESGTYYLWMRGYSLGTEDETVHVSLDRDWTTSVIAKLCSSVQGWQWASHERQDPFSCGNIGELVIEVPTAGLHTVSFAAREDGFEIDKWLLTTDPTYIPRDKGPEQTPR